MCLAKRVYVSNNALCTKIIKFIVLLSEESNVALFHAWRAGRERQKSSTSHLFRLSDSGSSLAFHPVRWCTNQIRRPVPSSPIPLWHAYASPLIHDTCGWCVCSLSLFTSFTPSLYFSSLLSSPHSLPPLLSLPFSLFRPFRGFGFEFYVIFVSALLHLYLLSFFYDWS